MQEALVEVAIGNLTRRTVVALEEEGELLLPAVEFFGLIELRVSVDSTGRLSAVRYPEEVPIFLDPALGTAAAGNTAWAIDRSQVIWHSGTLYVAVPVLADLLDVRFHMDWSKLRVTLMNPVGLPIDRRLARERARLAGVGLDGPIPDYSLALQRPGWNGAVFDWAVYYPGGGDPVDRTLFRGGLGLNVLGGSLELEYRDFNQIGGRTTASWLGVWPEQDELRQLGLGDVTGTGPRPAQVRGIFLSNSPFLRPAFFRRDVLRGDLPPGWEVEVYRNNRLVDFTEAGPDGRYRLLAPLDYGPNPLELRAYGPSGQVRIWEQTVPVQPDRLPPEVFEYGVSAGQCRVRACELAGNLDLRYGLTSNWTIRGGVEAYGRDTLDDLVHPYASVFGTIDSRWVVRAAALWNGFFRGDLIYAPSPDLRIGAAATAFDAGITEPLLTPRNRKREYRAFGFWRPDPRRRTLFLEATALRLESVGSSFSRARLGGSLQTGIVRWMGGVRREVSEAGGGSLARNLADLSAFANLRTPAIPVLNGLFVQSRIELSRNGFERLEWVASRSFVGPNRIDARISWVRGTDAPFISLGVTAFLPGARTISQMNRTHDGRVQAQAFAEGSVIWNGPAGSVNVTHERSLRRGGLGGLVFLDANGNGRYDSSDQVIEAARVQVGPYSLVTDQHGRFAIWDLVPFVATSVALDSMSLPNPLWVPTFALATVMVSPNMVRHLDIPVLPAAEVAGRVTLRTASGSRPVSGFALQFVSRETGRLFETTTFSDGEFYLLGLPPGTYDVTIPWLTSRTTRLRLDEPDLRFQVRLEDGVASAPFVEVELVPDDS